VPLLLPVVGACLARIRLLAWITLSRLAAVGVVRSALAAVVVVVVEER
jgi:hypothetical protein